MFLFTCNVIGVHVPHVFTKIIEALHLYQNVQDDEKTMEEIGEK